MLISRSIRNINLEQEFDNTDGLKNQNKHEKYHNCERIIEKLQVKNSPSFFKIDSNGNCNFEKKIKYRYSFI